ncbi:MAG: hypothetical protein KGJ07_06490 [Patescibacteria group bacterium]|nr:hypothetical protein [Patescibacteria group bacterium]
MDNFDPFVNVPAPTVEPPSNSSFASGDSTPNFSNISVGNGSSVFHVDRSGMWLGATKFADAVFSVDINGVITSKSTVSSTTMTIDGGNGREVWNDGTTNRIVIGNV